MALPETRYATNNGLYVAYQQAGDQDALVGEIQEFVTGVRPLAEPDRVLATILFAVHELKGVPGQWRILAVVDGP